MAYCRPNGLLAHLNVLDVLLGHPPEVHHQLMLRGELGVLVWLGVLDGRDERGEDEESVAPFALSPHEEPLVLREK